MVAELASKLNQVWGTSCSASALPYVPSGGLFPHMDARTGSKLSKQGRVKREVSAKPKPNDVWQLLGLHQGESENGVLHVGRTD
jgi:hypothetical protein